MKLLRRNYKLSEIWRLRKKLLKIILNKEKIWNFVLVKISKYLKLKKCLGLPINILIEPTADCNYKCLKCPRQYGYVDDGLINGSKDIPFEQYRRVIDEIGDKLITLRLWHYGEPFLNKNIFRMIEYADKKDIVTAISSNLSLLNKDVSEKLIDSGLDYLLVSFDGATEETYNNCCQKNMFHTVMDNLEALLEKRKNKRSETPFIELQFVIMDKNEDEMDSIKKIADRLGVDKLSYVMLTPFGCEMPKENKYRMSLREVSRINFCCLPWEEAIVRYSGIVIPCSMDIQQAHKMGKLFNGATGNFRSVWNNARYRHFREQIADNINDVDICVNCTKRDNNIHYCVGD